MIDPRNLDTLAASAVSTLHALKAATPLGKGLGASPGAACGKVVFTADDAEAVGCKRARKSSWFVWRPLQRILPV